MGKAIRINTGEELKAIRAGQCGFCRVGATHQPTKQCYKFKEHYVKMIHCNKCGCLYSAAWFDVCPMCQ